MLKYLTNIHNLKHFWRKFEVNPVFVQAIYFNRIYNLIEEINRPDPVMLKAYKEYQNGRYSILKLTSNFKLCFLMCLGIPQIHSMHHLAPRPYKLKLIYGFEHFTSLLIVIRADSDQTSLLCSPPLKVWRYTC